MEKKTFAEAIKGTTGAETVLRVLNEGGSISVTRTRSEADTWQFYVTNDESGWLEGLTDEFPPGEGYGINESEPVATFDEALRLLDEHPWYEMRPDLVHPDFRAAVWTAVLERRMAPKRERIRWQSRLSDDWRRLCAPEEPKENGHPGERLDLEGMTAAREHFCRNLPAGDSHAAHFRRLLVGRRTERALLEQAGFVEDADFPEPGCWRWSGGHEEMLHVYVSEELQILDVRLGEPYYRFEQGDVTITFDADDENYEPDVTRLTDDDYEPDAEHQADLSKIEGLPVGMPGLLQDQDWRPVLAEAERLRKRECPHRAARLVIEVARRVGRFTDASLLTSLVAAAAELGLAAETAAAIRQLASLGALSGIHWTNIGTIVRQAFGQPDVASRCFERALMLDPGLDEPRWGLWFSGRDILETALRRGTLQEVLDIQEMLAESGGDCPASAADYWLLAGLFYEGMGARGEARRCYERELALHAGCVNSRMALRRLKERDAELRGAEFKAHKLLVAQSERPL